MRRPLSPLVLVGGTILAVVIGVAVLAPALAPYDPLALVGGSLEAPSARHLLGTDDVGHDLLSQLIWGTRASVIVGGVAAAAVMAMALAVAMGCGLLGGAVDRVGRRLLDTTMAVPMLPLLVLVASLAGPSRITVIAVISMVLWPFQARVLRAQVLTIRQRGYIAATQGFGAGVVQTMRRHLLPALWPLVVAGLVRTASIALVLEAGLAFLGVADPLGVSWGLTLNRALTRPAVYADVWTWWLPPSIAITVAVLGFTFVAVGLEARANPRWDRRS